MARVSDLEAELACLQLAEVPPAHKADLRDRVRVIHDVVAQDHRVAFPNAYSRESFAAHFPELHSDLIEWDRALGREHGARQVLHAKLSATAEGTGLREPVYVVGVIVDQLAAILVSMSLDGALGERSNLLWYTVPLPLAPDGAREVVNLFIRGRPQPVAIIPREPLETEQERYDDVTHRLQDVFHAAREWPETRAIAECRDARREVWSRVFDRVERDQHREVIRISTECPICRDNLNHETRMPSSEASPKLTSGDRVTGVRPKRRRNSPAATG